jgi:hypothetical protein
MISEFRLERDAMSGRTRYGSRCRTAVPLDLPESRNRPEPAQLLLRKVLTVVAKFCGLC